MTNKKQHPPLIVIAGPTAVGKTDLSIQLAKQFDGEIINGDSLQVYRGLDIGTGKITQEEMENIPHHLLSILSVKDPFDAARFKQLAEEAIEDIDQRGKLPILVGGTGLYLDGLIKNLSFGGPKAEDLNYRQQLEQLAQEKGDQYLWEQLNKIDPTAAKKIPYQNRRRTIRALEVIHVTGKLFSKQLTYYPNDSKYDTLILVLDRPRAELYDRINLRVEQMVDEGLEKEAKQLYDEAKGQDWQSIKGIGYKEWWPYFNGSDMSVSQVIETIQQNSRRYAKRQLTWFRNRLENTHWLDATDEATLYQNAYQLTEQFLTERRRSYD
ncbi:tRNA (adenosine(37)-N6)-dimethylallyltransferase MiaA [Dolosicoccus paucivorans]|uniref:tRNA dimethylallyltransferase n=1 Tax=Dolosicoccus paucivorans TaxID=84521 RepID=A0A1G8LLI5_9LACT|nr:tRNA (adenosine(37)-N6)-dimethylallyltransferase MiaA [Dolosicoccus paucivorans]PMB84653.1 tRNA (adenosine(37)-N6)-dimethylallyltransferase MiaA [Dolosicoccus paucivorans]PMC59243.1 tRNA (adenosine(37)-N6)-dimethylallyltransferase MiaA [Dolosicoccus paucivorans]SDI56327.1 tRNA dimethylallyltransferase [Dolosicoccus paucivorans]